MNIFRRELRAHRKGLIIWGVCLFLLVVSGMSKYSAYSAGGASSEVFDALPQTMKALLGIGSFDVTQMSGFFAMLFLYIELTVAIHAVLLGSGIIAKEERDKTVEFLMAKPVSRGNVITAKLLASLVQVVILNLVTLVSSLVMVSAYNKGEAITGEILQFMTSLLLVQFIFLSMGTALSALLKRPKTAGSIATGILLGCFVISKITDLTDELDALNVLSPFKYFSYERIVKGEGIHAGIAALSVILVAVLVFATYSAYRKRELNV
ncbi:ABC transporter permease subunit [Paenibacillus sp. DXFW5]|uniref:ABC transporter permease subunit n=1 Tax=Paenibacillus rhizolycopersici TaxID=2780073 RepID=A0ABS2H9K0_9BACL|nr:ABC transporter permease subunit [Paenibacillus rhizolycopersici]MBM6997406.1 ABC transporter permease subunit [Paenibacillus rhizolycopersici]